MLTLMKYIISDSISPQVKQQTLLQVQKLISTFPFLVQLTPKERKSLLKMNDKRYTFVKKAITYGRQYPKVVPSYLDFNELEKDVALYDDLTDVVRALKPFLEMLEDTGIAVSGESYRGALAIYHNAEQGRHHDLQGADTIYEDLRKLFPRTGPAETAEDTWRGFAFGNVSASNGEVLWL